MFKIIAVPFDAYADLPTSQDRWLLTCLARYTNRMGEAFPSMRQLACDARMSLATVSRRLKVMGELSVFQRCRLPGGGRYRYTLAEPYRLHWPERVSRLENRVPQAGTREAKPGKYPREALTRRRFVKSEDVAAPDWAMRLRSWQKSRFWQPFWGPKPSEPDCWAPALR